MKDLRDLQPLVWTPCSVEDSGVGFLGLGLKGSGFRVWVLGLSLWSRIQGSQGYLVHKKTQLKETDLQRKGRRTVNLWSPKRARNEGPTGPQRFDDTRCTTKRRRINYRGLRKTGVCGHQNHSITCKSRILGSCMYRLWTCSAKVALPL